MTFDARWQIVTCARCTREYQCRPLDDFNSCANCDAFPADTPTSGLCDDCLLAHNAQAHAVHMGSRRMVLIREEDEA